jgi:serine phosphatase RsbU (regulator of sigma subunit)
MEMVDGRLARLARPHVSTFVLGIDGAEGGDRALSFTCPNGELYVLVCDVSGSGQRARPPAEFLVDAARILVCQGMSLALVMQTLSEGMRHFYGDAGLFASAFLAVIRERSITYVSAGHPDALLFADLRKHVHLPASGPLLGLFRLPRMNECTLSVRPGSTLAVATDGITEAPVGDGARLEESGFARAVAAACASSPDDLAACIVDVVRERAATFADDCAVLAVRM